MTKAAIGHAAFYGRVTVNIFYLKNPNKPPNNKHQHPFPLPQTATKQQKTNAK